MTNNVAPNWPVISGEYTVGDPEKQVVVVTLASEFDRSRFLKKVALIGTMKTENIGIEKVIGNVLSNANIRYIIVCGAEVHGHLAGNSLISLIKNGVDSTGRIVGAPGAIPYISDIPADIVDRFRRQVELIDLLNVEDLSQIEKAIDSAAPKDAFPEGYLVITLGVAKEKEVEGVVVHSPELVSIESRVRAIESEVKMLGKMQKFMAGIYSGIYQGFLIGFVATLVIGLLWRMR